MLKADFTNNGSNNVVGFILYSAFFFLLGFLLPFFIFLSEFPQLQSDPEGMCHPRHSRQSFYDRRPTSHVEGVITVIAAVQGPRYYAPYAFYGFIYCVL